MKNKGGFSLRFFIRRTILLLIIIAIFYGTIYRKNSKDQVSERPNVPKEEQVKMPTEITEKFIRRWLENDNGTIATYIEETEVDEDQVQGREALAETLGLMMYYALGKDDKSLFDEVYKQLTDYFLEEDGFVNWKIDEDGTKNTTTNALIDDIRILYALSMADEKWYVDRYMETAVSMSDYLNKHNIKNDVYTNFYDKEYDYSSPDINLSYIDIQGMEVLVERDLLEEEAVTEMSEILREAPLDNGFYPMSYDVEEKEYTFSEEVNIVDQAIVAYHFAQVGNNSKEFLEFIKNEMSERELVHGMYDLKTKEPTVDYESPAIYGFLILYLLEADEEDLAQSIYERLKKYQVVNEDSEYYGGYSITEGNTHIFDNLIPLLAEQEIQKLEDNN